MKLPKPITLFHTVSQQEVRAHVWHKEMHGDESERHLGE